MIDGVDMPPPARGCLPRGRRGSPVQSACRLFILVYAEVLYHEGCDECKDGVELRESGVDHGVGLNVMSL